MTTGGTLSGILKCSGKLYNKTLYIYEVVVEALDRLLLIAFLEYGHAANDDVDEVIYNLIIDPTRESLNICLNNEAVKERIASYWEFQE